MAEYFARRAPVLCAELVLAATLTAPALTDPCKAPLPSRPGQAVADKVRYTGDGDSLCVEGSANPSDWIEVRLANADAPQLHSSEGPRAKATLAAIALGRFAFCRAEAGRQGRVVVWDGMFACCQINGETVESLLRAASVLETGLVTRGVQGPAGQLCSSTGAEPVLTRTRMRIAQNGSGA